jgi:glycine dehydrogenase subunit 1
MDFTPHTDADVERMLTALGLQDPDDLFSHLPPEVRVDGPLDLPDGRSEPEVMRTIDEWGSRNRSDLVCFAGGGVYDHFLPPVVRALTLRPEFVTSYTPYQSEVSQGVLQALFEYQSMVAAIMGLPVANASLYDGSTSGLEAVNLAVAATRRSVVWVSRALHPRTREVIDTFAHARDLVVVEHPVVDGRTAWAADAAGPPAAVLFGQPNYLGIIEDYDAAVAAAHDAGALAIASVDPMLLGVLRSRAPPAATSPSPRASHSATPCPSVGRCWACSRPARSCCGGCPAGWRAAPPTTRAAPPTPSPSAPASRTSGARRPLPTSVPTRA